MKQPALFLSVKPAFANKILDGTKSIELRRIRPNVVPGQTVLIYSSSPEMRLLGSAYIKELLSGTPSSLWRKVKQHAGVSHSEYGEYFDGAPLAIGLRLGSVRRLAHPISLQELRVRWPWLRPPQSYRYVLADFERNGDRVTSLAPV